MASVPVVVHVTPSSCSLMNRHEQWAFRCLTFYARPVQTAHEGIPGLLTMKLVQVNILTNDQRCLLIEPAYDASVPRKVTQIDVRQVPSMPPQAAMEKKFWTTPFYECSEGSNTAERVEYTHKELIYHLNDPSVQQRLLRNANVGMSVFWQSLVKHLVIVGVIAPESVQEYFNFLTQSRLGPLVPFRTL